MSRLLKVGLVGYGYSGRTFHAPLITATPGLALTAVASSQVDLVATDYPAAQLCETPEILFARADIDLVVLATPNASHYPLARAALRAGKHLVVDKPFTLNVAEAEALQAAASQTDRLLSAFHNRRWDSDFLLLKQLLVDGALGHITQFESRYDRFRPLVRKRWRESAVPGSGNWFDLGPHLIDQALQLFGHPEAITADIHARRDGAEAADDAFAVLHYPDKRVVLGASCLMAGGSPRFLAAGTAGSLLIKGLDVQEDQLKAGIRPGETGWAVDPRQATLFTETGQRNLNLPDGQYTAYYTAIRDALLGHGKNPVPPSEALAVMRVIEAGIASSTQGVRIRLG
ncbi:oxidoreductase [Chitinimonas sp. BJB300]|uniref:oxidoreductase n=1 Tax=Chitinimonas sp. BJB300 TaxID=1559339 RepID=UPI000C0CE975|nr:oxidoreductase [Chitinimonas sp. BJB300]PHV13248.1 oxidoreductase [Chitinimonas sp. BJB300]TSJ89640.1 oxidoreductase [Chitinimonas sp. BJB300]